MRRHMLPPCSRLASRRPGAPRPVAGAVLLGATLAWAAFAGPLALGQEVATPAEPAAEQVTPEDITGRLKTIQEAADAADPAMVAARDLYNQALAELETAAKAAANAAEFKRRADTAAKELEPVQQELAKPPAVPTVEAPKGATVQELQQTLEEKKQAFEKAKELASQLDAEATRRVVAQKDNPGLINTARQEVDKINGQLAAPAKPEDPPALALAKRTGLLARRQALTQQIACYENELAAYKATAELFPLMERLADAQLALAQKDFEGWQELVHKRRQREAQGEVERARAEAEQPDLSPALQKLADKNLALAKEAETLAADIKKNGQQLQDTGKDLEDLQAQFKRSRDRVEAVGLTTAVGLLLRTRRAELPDVSERYRTIRDSQDKVRTVQLRLFELDEERAKTAELPSGIGRSDLERAKDLLEKQETYLDGLATHLPGYLRSLVDLDEAERKLIAETEAYATFIDERILWIQSTELLELSDFRSAADAMVGLLRPEKEAWGDVGHALLVDAAAKPFLFVPALCVFALWLYGQRRLRTWVGRIGERARKSTSYEILPTLGALGLTIVIVALWPSLLGYLAWRLRAPSDASDFVNAVAAGLAYTAWFWLPLDFFRQLCRSKGVAEAHFGWPRESLRLVRKHLRWFLPVSLPLVLLLTILAEVGSQREQNSLGRLIFVALLLSGALLMHSLLRPWGGLLRSLRAHHSEQWLYRFRRVWYPLGVLLPLILALLAVLGYYYTAEQLTGRLLWTIYVFLTLTVLGAVLSRWVLVVHRKSAIEWARRRRAEAQADAATAAPASGTTTPSTSEPDLTAISTQVRRLVQGFIWLTAIIGIWLIWSGVLPALAMLEEVSLWQITVADLGLAVLVAAATVVATRNVPGLLEIAMLRAIHLDSGARYAITTVSRYAIAIVGLILTCGVLGISWSAVQWLIAAMGVGLGFGLQEIFANFVSGLILFFERPIRIGDIVTIDDVTGVVTKIQIRATTITNWDKKEFIVPNKEFITGRLLNWTLSNQMNRIVINVGIAYGTDTERARELLLKIAQDHPAILDDPAPMVTFEQFGDSSLGFVVRCFLPNLDNRLGTIHELYTAIHKTFQEEGIEIAFPQLDLHVRSGAELLKEAGPPQAGTSAS